MRPALRGCLAFVRLKSESASGQPQPLCSSSDAVEIAKALLAVNVRSLAIADRTLCMDLLHELIEVLS